MYAYNKSVCLCVCVCTRTCRCVEPTTQVEDIFNKVIREGTMNILNRYLKEFTVAG